MLEEVTRAGLAAILPVYKNGNVTKLITYDGKERIDVRTCRTVLKNIARIYGADLTALRKMYGRPLNKSYSIPIPFSLDMVLMPIKVRKKPLGNNWMSGPISCARNIRPKQPRINCAMC